MRPGWRVLAKTAAGTAALTTVFWFTVGAWWYQRHLAGTDASPTQPSQSDALPARAQPKRGAPRASPLVIPVAGVAANQLSDTYAQARAMGARRHDAIDIMAPRGARVVAAAAGKLEKLFLSEDGGNTIYIRSPDGRRLYYYAHLDHYAPCLGEGMTVRQGATIGAVGTTGNASPDAPHLHFAIWMTTPGSNWSEAGVPLNPYPLLHGAGPARPGNESP